VFLVDLSLVNYGYQRMSQWEMSESLNKRVEELNKDAEVRNVAR